MKFQNIEPKRLFYISIKKNGLCNLHLLFHVVVYFYYIILYYILFLFNKIIY